LNKLENLNELSWVRVSLNAGTRETYAKVHQTKAEDFDRVVANLKAAMRRKGTCVIGAQMTLIPENQDETEIFKALGKEIGLDYSTIKKYLQPRPAVQTKYSNFIPIVPAGDESCVVRNNAFETETIPYPRCLSVPYLWAYIMANGDVYACSAGHLLDDRFVVGNIYKQTFKQIWQGDKRRKLWEFMKTYDLKECRVNCHLNQTNIYLTELVNDEIPHVNFI
jgi:radical SAM protein with 4Fe4S-binding SPASM domain